MEIKYICDKCYGSGINAELMNLGINAIIYCDKCRGSCELNWLEEIFGKKMIMNINDEIRSKRFYNKILPLINYLKYIHKKQNVTKELEIIFLKQYEGGIVL